MGLLVKKRIETQGCVLHEGKLVSMSVRKYSVVGRSPIGSDQDRKSGTDQMDTCLSEA